MKYAFASLAAIATLAATVYLITLGKDGWGWVLFVGMLCTGAIAEGSDSTK